MALDFLTSNYKTNPHPKYQQMSAEDMLDEGYKSAREYVARIQNEVRETATVRPSITRNSAGAWDVALSFHKGEAQEQVGWATRTIRPGNIAEIGQIKLAGETGILKPLYKAESDYFMSKNYRVKGDFVSDITRKKFVQNYPGAIFAPNGVTGMWTPTLGGQSMDAAPKAAAAMPEMKAVRSGLTFRNAEQVAIHATGQKAGRSVMKSKSMLGALTMALKGIR